MCLDSISSGNSLYMHVSKPPKENTPVNVFYKELKSAAEKYHSSNNQVPIEGIHKKINLADDILAWEHERYSIRRLPAFTLSTIKVYKISVIRKLYIILIIIIFSVNAELQRSKTGDNIG